MIQAFLIQLGLCAVCALAIFVMLRRSDRRATALHQQYRAELEQAFAPPTLVLPSVNLSVSTALSEADWAVVRTPSPGLERALARLQATVDSGVTDEDDDVPPAPPVPIDLGDLADRLSDAGYDGGPLRLAGVEVQPDRRVVVHLEPHTP